MDRKSWMKILSGCSMASLILAGCGGGGGGGGGAAPIKTAAQAQQAAVSTTLVMGDGLSSLVAPPGGEVSRKNLPPVSPVKICRLLIAIWRSSSFVLRRQKP